jgi:hypothetical protein
MSDTTSADVGTDSTTPITDLTPFAAGYFSFMSPDFAEMKTPSLIVAGDHDDSLAATSDELGRIDSK